LLPFTPLLAECRFDYSYYAEYRHLFQVKTRSGKGNASAQKVSVSVSETFEIEEVDRTKKPKPENLEPVPSSDPDKLMQTTFRLGLKISEKEAKSQVKLKFKVELEGYPYLRARLLGRCLSFLADTLAAATVGVLHLAPWVLWQQIKPLFVVALPKERM
jgi:hypothetical protein